MRKMPPTHRLGMFYGQDLPNYVFLCQNLPKETVVRTIAENMTDGEDCFLAGIFFARLKRSID